MDVQEVDDIVIITKVDAGKVNLIQNLNTKKNISRKFLKLLTEASYDKINKRNNCCQIIANVNESNQLNKILSKQKLRTNT